MAPGRLVAMNHPDGFATITDGGGRFIGWVPNGMEGSVFVLTPDSDRAVVHFDGKLIATVSIEHLRVLGAGAGVMLPSSSR